TGRSNSIRKRGRPDATRGSGEGRRGGKISSLSSREYFAGNRDSHRRARGQTQDDWKVRRRFGLCEDRCALARNGAHDAEIPLTRRITRQISRRIFILSVRVCPLRSTSNLYEWPALSFPVFSNAARSSVSV